MINKSEAINELATALAKAQAKIRGAIKDTANPFFKSKYADLAAVWDVAREPLASNGLSVSQLPSTHGDLVQLDTILMHASGQWIASSLAVKPMKQDPQGVGSALTYLRRYSFSAMVGVAQEDDDGNAATKGRSAPEPERDDTNQDGGDSIPFDPNNEAHKAWLRKELIHHKVTGQLAFDVLASMTGKFAEDLEDVIRDSRGRK